VFVQAIKYLLSVSKIKREANAMNIISYTALDVLEAIISCPRDFKSFEIQNILKKADVKISTDLNSSIPLAPSSTRVDGAQRARSRFRRWWGCVHLSLSKCWKHQGNWMEKTRGTLMIVATVIATMAFQAGISPPGCIWQQDTSNCTEGYYFAQDNICEAGTTVLSYSSPDNYLWFLHCNTIAFFASLCVILLVIIGFSLRSKLFIWLLTSAITISVASIYDMDLYTSSDVGDPGSYSRKILLVGLEISIYLDRSGSDFWCNSHHPPTLLDGEEVVQFHMQVNKGSNRRPG
jgi:hypothetical protein